MTFVDYPGHFIAAGLLIVFAFVMVLAYRSENLHGAKMWRPVLWFLQFVVIAGLLLILWNPSQPKTSEQTVRNFVLVFFDTSRSMSVVEKSVSTRLDKAKNLFQARFNPSDPQGPEYKFFGFDRYCYNAETIDSLRRWGRRTNLHEVITMLNRYEIAGLSAAGSDNKNQSITPRVAGAVIFTDGQAEDKSVNAYLPLRNKDLTIAVIGIGSSEPQPDLVVKSLKSPLRVAIDTAYQVQVELAAKHWQKEPVTVELLKDEFVIDTKRISAGDLADGTSLEFIVGADTLGKHIISARASTTAKEINTANNVRRRDLEVVETTKRKILFYSQVANSDIGKVRQALSRDKKIELDFGLDAVISPALAKNVQEMTGHKKLPRDQKGFFEYDVIILGPCALDALTDAQIDGLYSFVVDRGGGLILMPGLGRYGPAGWENKSLKTLVPVTFENKPVGIVPRGSRTIKLTLEGIDSKIISQLDLREYESLIWPYYNNLTKKPAAATLAELNDSPLLLAHRIGRGRVCLINTSKLFRWYREDLNGGLLEKFMAGLTAYAPAAVGLEATLDLFAQRVSGKPDVVQFEAYVRDNFFSPVSGATVLLDF